MSINSETSRTSFLVHLVQGTVASLGVNAAIHPMSTLKNLVMANGHYSLRSLRSLPFRSLYSGYGAICGTDAVTFSLSYLANNQLRSEGKTTLWSSILIGLITTPFVALGEGLMANRQVNALEYSKVAVRALRLNGLIMTAFREMPFSAAVFFATPYAEGHLREIFQTKTTNLGIQITAAAVTGFAAGVFTTPADLLKTVLQTQRESLSIVGAAQRVVNERGWRAFGDGRYLRGTYVALAAIGMNLAEHAFQPLRLFQEH